MTFRNVLHINDHVLTNSDMSEMDVPIDDDILKEFESFRPKAYSVFELPDSHDRNKIYLLICRNAVAPISEGRGRKSQLKHFDIVTQVEKNQRRARNGHNGRLNDFISLDAYGRLVAVAGIHVLLNHQKTAVEKFCAGYHLDLSSKFTREITGHCVECLLKTCSAEYSPLSSKIIKEAFDLDYEESGCSSVLHQAKEYSLDESKPMITRLRCRSLYMGRLFDVSSTRKKMVNRTILYLGCIPVKSNAAVLFTVDEDSGCLNVSPLFPIKDYDDCVKLTDKTALTNYISLLLDSVPQTTVLVNINIHDFDVFDNISRPFYHWSGSWYKEELSPVSETFHNNSLPYIPTLAIAKFLTVLRNQHHYADDDFWGSFDEECYGENWPERLLQITMPHNGTFLPEDPAFHFLRKETNLSLVFELSIPQVLDINRAQCINTYNWLFSTHL